MRARRNSLLALLPAAMLVALLAQAGTSAHPHPPPPASPPPGPSIDEAADVLARLIPAIAVSGDEEPMRAAVRDLLPEGLAAEQDAAGNLLVSLGDGESDAEPASAPPAHRLVFIAHMDEIGFVVRGIAGSGELLLEGRGGFQADLFAAREVVVRTRDGRLVPGVLVPHPSPRGAPDAQASAPVRPIDASSLAVDLGTSSQDETARLGVQLGDTVAVPRALERLGPTRACARAMDDRVGCAALILALRRIDRTRLRGATVLFAFSVREEIGLQGSAALAAARRADTVFAVDSFVSSESPRESDRFSFAALGEGAVIRAVDRSNVAPPAAIARVRALARDAGISLQVGATAGYNDGSVWVSGGATCIPIGWPMRSAHTAVETIDLRDLAALADLVRLLAEEYRGP